MSTPEENGKKEKFTVKIDTERTEFLARENERLKLEKEQKPEKSLEELKLQAVEKFGRPDLWLQATSKEMLSDMITNFINDIAEKANPTQKPSGSAPMNAQQYGSKPEDLFTKRWENSDEMVKGLRKLAHEGNKDAEHYLDQILKKFIIDKRSNSTRPEPSFNPNSPEAILDLQLEQKDGFLTPANKEDGDLGKLQKKWRLERLRKMREKALERGSAE